MTLVMELIDYKLRLRDFLTWLLENAFRSFWFILHVVCYIGAWTAFIQSKWWKDSEPSLKEELGPRVACLVLSIFLCYMCLWAVCGGIWWFHEIMERRWWRGLQFTGRFFGAIIFPIASVLLGTVLQDVAGMWCCIFASGSNFCLLVVFGVNDDYGSSDAFIAVALGVVVNLRVDDWAMKCVVISFFGALRHLVFPLLRWLIGDNQQRGAHAEELGEQAPPLGVIEGRGLDGRDREVAVDGRECEVVVDGRAVVAERERPELAVHVAEGRQGEDVVEGILGWVCAMFGLALTFVMWLIRRG